MVDDQAGGGGQPKWAAVIRREAGRRGGLRGAWLIGLGVMLLFLVGAVLAGLWAMGGPQPLRQIEIVLPSRMVGGS
jgi:hypothetical protein